MTGILRQSRIGLVVAIVSIWAAPIALAQTATPCLPDCDSSAWSTSTSIVKIVIPNDGRIPNYTGGCEMTVEYVTRMACGVFHDFQIIRISVDITQACGPVFQWMVNNNNNGTVFNTWTRDIHNLADDIIAAQEFMLYYNGLPPGGSKDSLACGVGATTQWRASRGSCADWVWTDDCCWELLACPQVSCCLQSFSVCYDPVTEQPVVTPTISSYPTTQCGETPYIHQYSIEGEQCIPMCDDNH